MRHINFSLLSGSQITWCMYGSLPFPRTLLNHPRSVELEGCLQKQPLSKMCQMKVLYIDFTKKMDISRAIYLMNVSLSTKSLNTFVIYLGNSGSTSASIVSASMIRRTSSAKIYHHLSVEAPITKVISILMSAKESSPPYVAQALDKVSLHCIFLHTLLYKYY